MQQPLAISIHGLPVSGSAPQLEISSNAISHFTSIHGDLMYLITDFSLVYVVQCKLLHYFGI